MKRIFILLSFSFWAITFVHAQKEDNIEQLESIRIGFITNKLALTSEQSKEFWPVYEKYSQEKKEVRKAQKALKNASLKADDELRKDLETFLDLREKEVSIERKYYKEFQKVISLRQIAELYKAEMHFRKMLLEKLGGRRGKFDDDND